MKPLREQPWTRRAFLSHNLNELLSSNLFKSSRIVFERVFFRQNVRSQIWFSGKPLSLIEKHEGVYSLSHSVCHGENNEKIDKAKTGVESARSLSSKLNGFDWFIWVNLYSAMAFSRSRYEFARKYPKQRFHNDFRLVNIFLHIPGSWVPVYTGSHDPGFFKIANEFFSNKLNEMTRGSDCLVQYTSNVQCDDDLVEFSDFCLESPRKTSHQSPWRFWSVGHFPSLFCVVDPQDTHFSGTKGSYLCTKVNVTTVTWFKNVRLINTKRFEIQSTSQRASSLLPKRWSHVSLDQSIDWVLSHWLFHCEPKFKQCLLTN